MTANKTLEELKDSIFSLLNCYEIDASEVNAGVTYIDSGEAETLTKQILAQIEALYLPREAVASAIPKRREQLIDMAGRLYQPEWLQGYNQAINEIRSKLKLDDKETT